LEQLNLPHTSFSSEMDVFMLLESSLTPELKVFTTATARVT
jgi:hypothetical protein